MQQTETTLKENQETQEITVKFLRKPAKMGSDFIFWIPRVYIKNGLVDPSVEYEVILKKPVIPKRTSKVI